MSFDAFISYSHAADGRLAPAVQRGLHRLARPWHRRRALWIFRDQTGLSVTPGLWSSIQTAMDGSKYFVLLASPEAADSPWVNKEIEHWVATKSPQRLLPVLTGGEWGWDAATGDFTADSTAVPAALRGVFVEEPLYLDLRWARDDLHLSLRHARFRDAIAQLAAPMHGVSKDELESEDVRQLRRARRLWSTAVAMVVLLAMVASLTGVVAMRNAGWANASAVEAQRQQENAHAKEEQAEAAAAETRRQEQLAGEQRALADQAAADAELQRETAGQQKENARRYEEDARRQKEDARRYKEDARRQKEDARREKENAQRYEEDARRQKEDARRAEEDARQQKENAKLQEQLADKAEARAREQEKLAREHERLAVEATAERLRQEKLAREATEEARRQREEAALQRRIGINQRLVERARAMINDDPRKALMLGVAAQHLHSDAQTRDQLSHLVMSTNYAGAFADVTDVATVANGVLATADAGGTVSLWGIANPARPDRFAVVGTGGSAGKTLTPSPDGRTLAVFEGQSAVLWDVSDPAHPARMTELADAAGIVTVALSPDGRTVATSNRDKNTILWDAPRGQAPAALATLPSAHSLAFGPAGRTAVTSGATAIVWNVTDPARPVQLATLSNARSGGAILFNPKLPVVMVEEDGGWVMPWDLRDPAKPKYGFSTDAATGDSTLTRMVFSSDGLVLALGDSSGTTRLLNFALGSLPGQATLTGQFASLTGRDGPIRSITLSPDKQMLITSGERRSATLWKIRGAFARDATAVIARPSSADVVGLAFRPGGRALIAADAAGSIVSWDLKDPAHPAEGAPQQLNSGRIQLMDLSPDGRTLAVGGMDEVVMLLDVTQPAEPTLLATIKDEGDVVRALAFSPDGGTLAVGHTGGRTRLYDLADRTRPDRIAEVTDRGALGSIAFSPDGLTMGVTAGYNVSLYSLADRSAPVRHTELGMGTSTSALAFSPDGGTLAVAAGFTGAATLWDIADLAQPYRLATLQGAETSLRWLGFSPDGRTLATAGISEARLWEVTDRNTPIRFATLANAQLRTRDLAFSPDGHTLASGGSRSVSLWDYSVPEGLGKDPDGQACAITGRGLNAEEWARYIPELPHQPTC
ncbi:MAG: TIR domain-containing protein [Actinoplanes sp.]